VASADGRFTVIKVLGHGASSVTPDETIGVEDVEDSYRHD